MPIKIKTKVRKHGAGGQIYLHADVLNSSNIIVDQEVTLDVDDDKNIIIEKVTKGDNK